MLSASVIVKIRSDALALASRIASGFDLEFPLTLASGVFWIRRISHCLSLTGLASADGMLIIY
jgi:hypothetical protein